MVKQQVLTFIILFGLFILIIETYIEELACNYFYVKSNGIETVSILGMQC